MEKVELFYFQLLIAGENAVGQKNNILTDRNFQQISGWKDINTRPVIEGTTVQSSLWSWEKNPIHIVLPLILKAFSIFFIILFPFPISFTELQFQLENPSHPDSVCSLPCGHGKVKKHVEGESCCWTCHNCGTYQVGIDFENYNRFDTVWVTG